MKILTSLITAIVTIFHPAGVDLNMLSATYRSLQYCLTDYRAQHRIDQLLPEYSRECDANPQFLGNIDDPELYTLVGERYLEGKSPTSLNWESQPLTKYLFGLSSALFGTPLPVQLVLGLLTLIALYYLARALLPPYLSLIPPILLAIDPLFRDQLVRPYLDLSVTFFALLWLLYLGQRGQTKWYLGGIILGALALSKSFSLGILAAVLGLIIAPRAYLKTLAVAVITYLFGYTMFFVAGHTLLDLLTLHVNTLRLYRSYVPEYPKGEVFRIIIIGAWRTWWGDKGLVPSPFYTPLWTIGLVSALYVALCRQVRKHHLLFLHLVWVFLVLGFISLRLVFPRYLLPLLPSLYLLLVVGVKNLLASIFRFATVK